MTRGFGLLENFLSRKRIKLAEGLIEFSATFGRILDVGCGAYPEFLLAVSFAEKFGVDKISFSEGDRSRFMNEGVQVKEFDIEDGGSFPFSDSYFDIVTMLAVVEHLDNIKLKKVFCELFRVLKPNGRLIITTPAPWAHWILKLLAVLRIVSSVEISEHKAYYSHKKLTRVLESAGFNNKNMRYGFFEFAMNLWTSAIK